MSSLKKEKEKMKRKWRNIFKCEGTKLKFYYGFLLKYVYLKPLPIAKTQSREAFTSTAYNRG